MIQILVTFAALLALLVAPVVFLFEVMDLVDADDAARDRRLGVRQFDWPPESPDSDRIATLIDARALVTV